MNPKTQTETAYARRRAVQMESRATLRQQAALLDLIANAIEASDSPEDCARKLNSAADGLRQAAES